MLHYTSTLLLLTRDAIVQVDIFLILLKEKKKKSSVINIK